MPRVSVIIPTFNCARFLGRALDSAFAQTFMDYEIIVADDGSTDTTQNVVGQYEGKVKYLYQENRGPSAARNLALSRANGEFIAYLDADDMWYPHKLELQIAFMETNRECGIVHSDFAIIDETERVIRHRFNHEPLREVPHGACLKDLLRRCHIQIPTVIERQDCLQRIGYFDERIKWGEDYNRWILLAMEGFEVGYIDEALAMYRWRPGSLSSSQRRTLEGHFLMFEVLLHEKSLAARFGEEALAIVHNRLYTLQRDLAYLDRIEGHPENSRGRLLKLIWDRPLQAELYLDLLKSAVPSTVAEGWRRVRAVLKVEQASRTDDRSQDLEVRF